MKKLGLVGGIGPASTLDYYNDTVSFIHKQTGTYPRIVIDSINMDTMIDNLSAGKSDEVTEQILCSISSLKAAGADFAAICSNTPHIFFDRIKANSPLPLISITEAAAKYIKEHGFSSVLILGTQFTMKSGMYTRELGKSGIDAIVPDEEDIALVQNIIFPNLENGEVIADDKLKLTALCERYIEERKADAVLLGCTELPMMIKDGDLSKPVVNSTRIHINAITDELLR